MSTIGIITCETLELEIAGLLAQTPEMEGITVLEDGVSGRLIQALKSQGVGNLRCIPHMASFRSEPTESLNGVVRVLDLTLHSHKQKLRHAVSFAAHEFRPYVNALFLGYGSCGSALGDPGEWMPFDLPIFAPMDGDRPVEDCVALLLGGRKRCAAEQRKIPGTFFMTAGWTYHWRKLLNSCGNVQDERVLKRLFARYERSLLIETPVMQEEIMKQNSEAFNRAMGLRLETCRGTMELLTQAWKSAREYFRPRPGN